MASHSPYPQPGPGPSSYYQQPPLPPHHVYGSNSPGPRPNYYPYPTPPPQHMNTQYQHPTPSRGIPRGGSYGSRGAHHYHSYHQPPPQQPLYSHNHPLGVHPPHPQQHIPYSPQSAKYNQPYSPSYHYPSPTAPVFTPSWQTQQPISPLPKQLSMPPQNIPQSFYEPPSAPLPPPQITPTPQSPVKLPVSVEAEEGQVPSASSVPPQSPIKPPSIRVEAEEVEAPFAPPPEDAHTPSSSVPTQTSSYSQMGTITTTDSAPLPSSPTTSQKAVINPVAQWAVWSRRPQDPSHAPSIIISPRARPPPDVIHQALDLKTPPPSPPIFHAPLPATVDEAPAETQVPSSPPSQISDDIGGIAWSSQTNSSVPSSSVTETTDSPTIPGSPASSNTSLSVVGTPMKDARDISAHPAANTDEVPVSTPIVAEPAPAVPAEETVTPTSVPQAPTEMATSPVVVPPQPAAAPKKSWASLLRPASSSSSRNALPTSSVVGFSIPAHPSVPVLPSKKSELLTLLTTGPTPAAGGTSASASKIRPRGLVNSGNMCFANSVLQILVYCPPFHRLFVELGKVLIGPVVSNGKEDSTAEKNTPASGATPLVDATVTFLQEFVEDKKSKSKERAQLEVVVTRNGANGSSGSGRGKGKEKEVKEDLEDDDWDGDSFLPTYIYDAMKVNKRFDNMRGGHQEDAEEFFGFYLDTLEEELLSILHSINPPRQSKRASSNAPAEEKEEPAPPEDDGWLEVGKRNRTVVTRTIKATESPITRIFGGKFRSALRAPGQKDSVIVEDWRSLRLDIQRDQIHTIQDALSYISHPQPVHVTQAAKPGVTIEAQQQVLIEALPPILVLHIKRFCYDTAVNGVVKVGKHVEFGPELEIGPDVMVHAAKKTPPTRYKLFGVLYHHGLSASGGHYTLDVLHPNRYPSANPNAKPREGWVRIDDELVSDVRPEDVFGAYERDDSKCAYLLFYRRI